MASSPSRVGWDACSWIAHIQQERILGSDGETLVEDRGAMCRPVLEAAEKGIVEIVVSALCLVEVLARNRAAGIDDQKVRDFFDNDYILLVNLDKQVGDLARRLMLTGHPGLKPPDAVHLATACVANADEFHTFDDRLSAARPGFAAMSARRRTKPPGPLLSPFPRTDPATTPTSTPRANRPGPDGQRPRDAQRSTAAPRTDRPRSRGGRTDRRSMPAAGPSRFPAQKSATTKGGAPKGKRRKPAPTADGLML
jgi:predicted nucleic acid-binding protein